MIHVAEDRRWGDCLRAKALKRPPPTKANGSPRPGYEMREGAEHFLSEHPELRRFLDETGDKLRDYFGPETELAVERFVDPEASSVPDELFVRVKTQLDVADARERLSRFEGEWWLDNLQRGRYLINVALEYV